jgi:GTP-binding protein Era
VGKSTLLNAMLGQKLVIATSRPGTTRSNVLGVYVNDTPPTQIAFVDTPGMGETKTALHRALVDEAKSGLADVEAVLLVTDVGKRGGRGHPGDPSVVATAQASGAPIVVAINKVDLVRQKESLLPQLQAWCQTDGVRAVVPVSATRGTQLDALIREIRALLPAGLLYEEDILTDRPERFFVAELIREAVISNTRQEIPYGVAVKLDAYAVDGDLVRIDASIVVEKASHKGIVIGRGGSLLKKIGTEARLEIEKLVERKVFLKLWVRVDEGWTRDATRVRELTKDIER